jgi:hypothetical protein
MGDLMNSLPFFNGSLRDPICAAYANDCLIKVMTSSPGLMGIFAAHEQECGSAN